MSLKLKEMSPIEVRQSRKLKFKIKGQNKNSVRLLAVDWLMLPNPRLFFSRLYVHNFSLCNIYSISCMYVFFVSDWENYLYFRRERTQRVNSDDSYQLQSIYNPVPFKQSHIQSSQEKVEMSFFVSSE